VAKVTITMNDACDACWKRDKTPRRCVMELTLDGKTWFLCDEHEKGLAQQLVGLLGDPEENK
jgi:hypothetical protein